MKKLLFLTLGILIALPAIARDFQYTYEGKTLTYTVISEEDKTVKTKESVYSNIAGNAVSGDLVIPSTVYDENQEAYTLTEIGNNAFYSCTGLTSVTIPESVTSIGKGAFNNCSGLVKSAYPNTISNPFGRGHAISYDPNEAVFEDGVIYGAEKSSVLFVPLTCESLVLPESVTSIGNYAFVGCDALSSLTVESPTPPHFGFVLLG